MHEPGPTEGEYQAPATPHEPTLESPPGRLRARKTGGWGTLAAGAAVALGKLKILLALLGSSWTFLLTIWLYVTIFGWQLGVVLALAIAAHEFGHYFAYKEYGLAVRAPVFVPFLGAFTAGALAPDLEQDAYIALAGPVTGLVLAFACFGLGVATHERFWFACADLSAFLNLFNMLPVLPFDGGRVIGAIWPPLWIAGIALFVAASVMLHVPIIFVAFLAILGVPSMLSALRGAPDPRAATMTLGARVRVGTWYIATSLALLVLLGVAQANLPSNGGIW